MQFQSFTPSRLPSCSLVAGCGSWCCGAGPGHRNVRAPAQGPPSQLCDGIRRPSLRTPRYQGSELLRIKIVSKKLATTGRNRNPVDVRYNNPARRDHAAAGSCGGSWGPAGASGRGCRRPEQRSSREATSSATCTSRATVNAKRGGAADPVL